MLSLGSILLIAFGLGFLLYNLGIINFTPWVLLWPGLLIWLGVSQLVQIARRRRGGQDSWDIVLWLIIATVGVYLLLPRIGITVPSVPWRIIWPLGLILLGVLKLFPGNFRFIKVNLTSGSKKQGGEFRSSFIGEFNRGPGSWVLEDMSLHQSIGSINLDLTQAIVPDREVFLDISGYVGEVSIYLPPGLPFKAECDVSIGDITVVDQNESGTGRHVKTQSASYETSTRKVNIRVHWRIGEISIRQIR